MFNSAACNKVLQKFKLDYFANFYTQCPKLDFSLEKGKLESSTNDVFIFTRYTIKHSATLVFSIECQSKKTQTKERRISSPLFKINFQIFAD